MRQDTLLGPVGEVAEAVAATNLVLPEAADQVEKILVAVGLLGREGVVPVGLVEQTQDQAVEVLVITPQ